MRRLLILLLCCVPTITFAQSGDTDGITVAISDNIIVIDNKQRSGMIDLVNGSGEPVLFTVFPLSKSTVVEQSAEPILRWAPESGLAAAHRSLPFRVLARPTPELAAGEYAIQFGIRAEIQRDQPPIVVRQDEESNEPVVSAVVPVVPVLPVTIYVRHRMDTPRVDAEPLILTPEHESQLGYFTVKKRIPNASFVGQVTVEESNTGKILSSGRLHLGQQGDSVNVGLIRHAQPTDATSQYCLKLWDHFPAEGEPYFTLCND